MRGSGDSISRKAAREAVWQILNGMGYSEKHNDRLVEEVDAVFDDIPAADVRPVTRGEWKIQKASIHPYGNDVCCSECGFTMGSSFGYRFCPNCGCAMEET